MTHAAIQPRQRVAAPRYVIVLRAERSEVPADVRMRRLLKCARRCFGFRCVGIAQEPAAPVGP